MNTILQQFEIAISNNDKVNAATLCDQLVKELYHQPDQFSVNDLENTMKGLRAKRMIHLMVRLGDACLQTSRNSLKIRRQFAQSLIEEKLFTGAMEILDDIIEDTRASTDPVSLFERREAYGLTGRLYKQLYVIADNPALPSSVVFLKKALSAYYDIYLSDPNTWLWHGINSVAMAARAKSDKIAIDAIDTDAIAGNILQLIANMEANEKASAFDLATAVEACVALKKPKEAMEWVNKYIQFPGADAFEFASTLRQLTEVWRLDTDKTELQQLIPVIRGALLKKEGGTITINADEIRDGIFNKEERPLQAEKVFGVESYQSYEWYMKGAQCCMLIARIGREKSKGFGTGFLMNGGDFHEKLKNELVMLTNAHVVTNDPNEREALRPEEALILFEVLGLEKTYTVKELFFTSPFTEFDVTILRFTEQDRKEITDALKAKGVELFKISMKELKKEVERMYIIGHPAGGTLQLSLQDNALLDYEGRLLHYRTPTVGGSSGSPVFDDGWNLVGIHHAGGNYIRKLNGVRGMYQANEGIRITSIVEAVKKK